MAEEKATRSYLASSLGCYCPRCREGKLFKNPRPYALSETLKMNEACPVCGQPTEIEPGFYYGTAYVSYALTIAVSVATFVAWLVLIGMTTKEGDYRIWYWLVFNAVLLIALQPVFMRLARSIWISWFVKYDPNWKSHPVSRESTERIVKEHMGNW
ncbi:MAG: DUF983 domain-containing protein [Flavihumibacter sp.]